MMQENRNAHFSKYLPVCMDGVTSDMLAWIVTLFPLGRLRWPNFLRCRMTRAATFLSHLVPQHLLTLAFQAACSVEVLISNSLGCRHSYLSDRLRCRIQDTHSDSANLGYVRTMKDTPRPGDSILGSDSLETSFYFW
ncbi:hypothetical protein GALMADRAFT_385591 [Galerina marginata CBS 339.88]|uniref:Uncharacterized protein n=1 Tax=Galerina marginata (strain CBS 339.88) TaxID=685588 RepID=A0A067TTV4_GALM3|nr:hypothetical protein GALMADRAFT_385591 [Galerina marginata CBS 339.88]